MWLRFVTQGMDRDTGGQGRFNPTFQEHLREPVSPTSAKQEPTLTEPLPPGALRKESPDIPIAPASQSADAARGRFGVRKKASPKPSRKGPVVLIVVLLPMAALAAVGGVYFWKPVLLQPIVEQLGLPSGWLPAGRPPMPPAGLPSARLPSARLPSARLPSARLPFAKPVGPMRSQSSAGGLPFYAHPPLPPSAGVSSAGGPLASTASVAGPAGSGYAGSVMPFLPPQTLSAGQPSAGLPSAGLPSLAQPPLPMSAGVTASSPMAAAVSAKGGFVRPWKATDQTTSAGKPMGGQAETLVPHPAKPVASKLSEARPAVIPGASASLRTAARLPTPVSSQTASAKPATPVVARPVASKPVYRPAWHPVYHPVYRPVPRPAPAKPAPDARSGVDSVF